MVRGGMRTLSGWSPERLSTGPRDLGRCGDARGGIVLGRLAHGTIGIPVQQQPGREREPAQQQREPVPLRIAATVRASHQEFVGVGLAAAG
jgi:hypothetical protein